MTSEAEAQVGMWPPRAVPRPAGSRSNTTAASDTGPPREPVQVSQATTALCPLGRGFLPAAHSGAQRFLCSDHLQGAPGLDLFSLACRKLLLPPWRTTSPPLKPPGCPPGMRCGHWDRSLTGGPPPLPSNRASRRLGSAMDSSWAKSLNRDM